MLDLANEKSLKTMPTRHTSRSLSSSPRPMGFQRSMSLGSSPRSTRMEQSPRLQQREVVFSTIERVKRMSVEDVFAYETVDGDQRRRSKSTGDNLLRRRHSVDINGKLQKERYSSKLCQVIDLIHCLSEDERKILFQHFYGTRKWPPMTQTILDLYIELRKTFPDITLELKDQIDNNVFSLRVVLKSFEVSVRADLSVVLCRYVKTHKSFRDLTYTINELRMINKNFGSAQSVSKSTFDWHLLERLGFRRI